MYEFIIFMTNILYSETMKVKKHRQRIRKEEESSAEYGIEEEQRLNELLQKIIFQRGKERRRGDETRAANLKNRFNLQLDTGITQSSSTSVDLNALAKRQQYEDEFENEDDDQEKDIISKVDHDSDFGWKKGKDSAAKSFGTGNFSKLI